MESKGSDAAAVLVGMPGFVVLAAVEDDGELWLLVETTASTVGCPSCGVRAKPKDRRETTLRDLPVAGLPVVLVWRKRRWSCPDPDCEAKTWTEQAEEAAPRAVLNDRARREMCRLVGEDARSWPRWPGPSRSAGTPSWGRCASTAPPWSTIPNASTTSRTWASTRRRGWRLRPATPRCGRRGWSTPAGDAWWT